MRIPHNKLLSNWYPKAAKFYTDTINNADITSKLIPRDITKGSKMYINLDGWIWKQSKLKRKIYL